AKSSSICARWSDGTRIKFALPPSRPQTPDSTACKSTFPAVQCPTIPTGFMNEEFPIGSFGNADGTPIIPETAHPKSASKRRCRFSRRSHIDKYAAPGTLPVREASSRAPHDANFSIKVESGVSLAMPSRKRRTRGRISSESDSKVSFDISLRPCDVRVHHHNRAVPPLGTAPESETRLPGDHTRSDRRASPPPNPLLRARGRESWLEVYCTLAQYPFHQPRRVPKSTDCG